MKELFVIKKNVLNRLLKNDTANVLEKMRGQIEGQSIELFSK